ncbi:hypothetical protein C1I97_06785 [Streptomyces sp. NTH33]|nr:hypothetical protein C1I97_06785 [Streptomyces sp. NTH33]
MRAEHLAVPFKTVVLGVEVTIRKVDLLPDPAPEGAEWIEAYRHGGREGIRVSGRAAASAGSPDRRAGLGPGPLGPHRRHSPLLPKTARLGSPQGV